MPLRLLPLTARCRSQQRQQAPLSLHEFVLADDLVMFGQSDPRTWQDPMTLQLPSGPLPLPHPSPSPPGSPALSRTATAAHTYNRLPLADVLPLVHLTIRPASFASLEDLHEHLDDLDLTSEKRVRPTWDDYFSACVPFEGRNLMYRQ